jgi:hypothetical protein
MVKRTFRARRVLCIALLAAPVAACAHTPTHPDTHPGYVVHANMYQFGQGSVVCVTAGVTAWRIVDVPGHPSYPVGHPCPTGHEAGGSSCTLDTNGNYEYPYDGDGDPGFAQAMAEQVCAASRGARTPAATPPTTSPAGPADTAAEHALAKRGFKVIPGSSNQGGAGGTFVDLDLGCTDGPVPVFVDPDGVTIQVAGAATGSSAAYIDHHFTTQPTAKQIKDDHLC